jgi:CBS-domain-containing membrane protein
LVRHRISGVPVVTLGGKVIGIVSQSDLLFRAAAGGERKSKWWLGFFADPDKIAREYAKAVASILESPPLLTFAVFCCGLISVNDDEKVEACSPRSSRRPPPPIRAGAV